MSGRSSRPPGGRKETGTSSLERGRGVFRVAILCLLLLPAAQFHYLVPDSAGHVVYVRSLLWDGDFDFGNDYARFGMIGREGDILFGETTAHGKPGNPFGIGSALLWMPGVFAARVALAIAAAAGAAVATDGFGTATLFAVSLGTWTWILLALWLVRRTFDALQPSSRNTALALAGACLGTSLPFYVLQLPSYSHAPSAFAIALVLYLAVRWRAEWNPARALVLGSTVGLAGLVRAQDLAFGILPLGLALASGGLDRRRPVPALAYLCGCALAFAPQVGVWHSIYGSFFVVPQGSDFLALSAAKLGRVLVHPRHGLFAWSPVALLAAAGWIGLVRERSTRGLGITVWIAFLVQAVLNAMPADWWAGWSFGARRFVDCTPLFALGLWRLARHGLGARVAIAIATLAGLVQWLRIASGRLSAEADPGWDGLWGMGLVRFVPEIGPAVARVFGAGWTDLQLVQRPQAPPPDLAMDPASTLAVLYGLWLAGVLGSIVLYSRRSGARRL